MIPVEDLRNAILKDLWKATNAIEELSFLNIEETDINGFATDYGDKFWVKHAKYHREDGPAVECSNGTRSWYKNGDLHREDGPAIISSNGSMFWFLNGIEYTKEEYEAKLAKFNIDRTTKKSFA